MKHKVNYNKFLLIAIILLGLSVRVYKLSDAPSGFFADEAGQALSSYTILHTGKDINGNILPFYFNIFGPIGPVAIYDKYLQLSFSD